MIQTLLSAQADRIRASQARAAELAKRLSAIAALQRAFAHASWNSDELPELYILNCRRAEGDAERARLAASVSEIIGDALAGIAAACPDVEAAVGRDLLDQIFEDAHGLDVEIRERVNAIRDLALDVVRSENPQEAAAQAAGIVRSLLLGEWDARRHFHAFFERGAHVLVEAHQRVARGETALAPQRPQAPIVGPSGAAPGLVVTAPPQTPRRPRGGGRRPVTARQSQVFSVYTRFGSYTRAARELGLDESTVRAACEAVADKTGASVPARIRSRRLPRDRRGQIAVADRRDECERA